MIHFDWPWIFLVLPLPWLVYRLAPQAPPRQQRALQVPFLADFAASAAARREGSRQWRAWLGGLGWILLLVATARPQWLGDPVELPVSGRDLLLAVDLSGSMEVEDFELRGRRVDRLTATKHVAGEFIERRVGDRVGLVLFGRQAYLQAPLTFDRETVRTLLDEAVIGLAGKETAIGDAIGLAVKRLREKPISNKVLVLLTDGANTAGEVEPLKAAELAAGEGLRIYTIGIGADEMLVRSLLGTRRVNPSRDLDERTLKAIAETTGGRYFRARDGAELEKIYELLDELEPVEREKLSLRPQKALFTWPLSLAMLIGAVLAALPSKGAEQ